MLDEGQQTMRRYSNVMQVLADWCFLRRMLVGVALLLRGCKIRRLLQER